MMMSFKNGLRVYTPSNVIADALMIDFGSQNGPKISSKSLPKRFQRASEGALDEDSDLKLEKRTSGFIGGAPGQHKPVDFGAPGGGKQGGGRLSSHAGHPWDKPRGRRIKLFVADPF